MTSRYFRASIYLLPSLPCTEHRGVNARTKSAVPRANSVRTGAGRSVAGRIIWTVARRSSQYTATAAAPAISVARTNIATFTRIHMSAFLSRLRYTCGYGTVGAIQKRLKTKGLGGERCGGYVAGRTRRGCADAVGGASV